MTQSHPNSRTAASVSVLAALAVLGLAVSTAVAMSTGAIRPGDKPLTLTTADASCPANTVAPTKFPLFPLPQGQASYTITLTPAAPPAGQGSAATRSIQVKLPAQLLQSDFNSLNVASNITRGVTRWVDPTNLLELVTRMPTLLANAQLPANIPVDRAAQQFADLMAEIFDAKDHDHTKPTCCNHAKVAGSSNVWQVAILASDQASDLFERTDRPKPNVGNDPQLLKRNPYADKRAINVLKVVDRVRNRAEAARRRMLAQTDTAAMQRAFERIDGIGYLFSNFREPQWGQNSVNSYAMSLRDFARTVDRHLTRLQGRPDETRGFKITHTYKVTTTSTIADHVNILERMFNTPGAQFTGAFGILQQQQISPVNQFTNPAVAGGPVRTNNLNGCGIGNVKFTVYANGKKMIPVPYQGPRAFAAAQPVPQHVYRWTVPNANAASSAASLSLQRSIIESARSTRKLQWTLEAIATTEFSTSCPRVPVVPFVVNGVVPCTPPLKKVPNSANNKEIKAKIAKCRTRCSSRCRARCDDMCDERCEDRFAYQSCSSCSAPCASRSESMRRACALANEPMTNEQQVAGFAPQFSQQEEPAGDTEFAFTDASSVDQDAFQGADEQGADEQDFSMEEDTADEADFSLHDLVDEDAADDVDFSGEDALDEDALDEADFAAEDLFGEDAIEDDAAEEFALGVQLADLLDEESLEDDA